VYLEHLGQTFHEESEEQCPANLPFSFIVQHVHSERSRGIGLRVNACTGSHASRVAPSRLGSIKPQRQEHPLFATPDSPTMPHSTSPGSAQNDDEMPDAPAVETSTENNVKLEDMFNDDDDEFPDTQDVKMDSPPAKEEECVIRSYIGSSVHVADQNLGPRPLHPRAWTRMSCLPSINACSPSDTFSNGLIMELYLLKTSATENLRSPCKMTPTSDTNHTPLQTCKDSLEHAVSASLQADASAQVSKRHT
jgi:hypothetical protein